MGRAAKRFYLAVFALFGISHAQSPPTPHSPPESCAVDPNAIVSDACASYSTLDVLNSQLQPTLRSLTHDSDFFSYYRLNLYDKVCPFWDDESGMCGNIACAVNTIDNEEDIPMIWRADELGKLEGPKAHHPGKPQQSKEKPLMGELGADVGESCVVEYDDECDERDYCVPEDESAAGKGDYVSLLDNPERFTGYSGPSAHQVWEAIYNENCFSKEGNAGVASQEAAQDLRNVMRQSPDNSPDDELTLQPGDECLEKRTFYRVISGMHASISTHLCYDYLNQTTGQWGPNLTCYTERLHAYPDRISNLYFNYALVMRAVAKVRNALADYTFCSGDPEQDSMTKQKIIALSDAIASGPKIYDESLMFKDPSMVALKDDFRNRFRNVSRTMDCVGCDKCRLWGKLQTAGYGTALKILFEFDEKDNSNNPPLRRTELVALVNTLDKISHSLSVVGKFQKMLEGTSGVLSDAYRGTGAANGQKGITAETDAAFDDGFADVEYRDETVEESTIQDDTMRELTLIWNTTLWVLGRWIDMPKSIYKLLVLAATEVWDFWLGRTDSALNGLRKVWQVEYAPTLPEASLAAAREWRRKRDEM